MNNQTITLTTEQAEAFSRGESITLTPPPPPEPLRVLVGSLKKGQKFRHDKETTVYQIIGTFAEPVLDASRIFSARGPGKAVVVVDRYGSIYHTDLDAQVILVEEEEA